MFNNSQTQFHQDDDHQLPNAKRRSAFSHDQRKPAQASFQNPVGRGSLPTKSGTGLQGTPHPGPNFTDRPPPLPHPTTSLSLHTKKTEKINKFDQTEVHGNDDVVVVAVP